MPEMKENKGILNFLHRAFLNVRPQRKFQFFLLLLLTIVTSFAEVVSLGSVLPFIGILTQPEQVYNSESLSFLVTFTAASLPSDLIIPLTIIFIIAAIFSGLLRLLLLRSTIYISNSTGADFSEDIYLRTLHQPYKVHLSRSSSEIISGLTQKVSVATSVLASIIQAITSLVLLSAILLTLIYIDPVIALMSMGVFGLCYLIIALITRVRLKNNSKDISELQTKVVKTLQEGLGSIRDVLLDSSQPVYSKQYKVSISALLRSTGENQFITLSPRFAMETIGMVLIASFAYLLTFRAGGIASAIPLLGALALAAQRLLPLLQLIYGNWSNITGNQSALRDVVALLEQKIPKEDKAGLMSHLEFKEKIEFRNITFSYDKKDSLILKDANLTIDKCSMVGIVGPTGSGKSTVLDILMSLLEPISGKIFIDDQELKKRDYKKWKSIISHVPQSIFLTDSTIKENIAFGHDRSLINSDLVEESAKKAMLSDFIESLEIGYDTLVGEGGARISGGQKQRIGLARALYKESEILILDEATSALDNDTERKVMDSVKKLSKNQTIIIIAHRLSTLESCNKILHLEDGLLNDLGTYKDFISSEKFSKIEFDEDKQSAS